ncbi:TonB-dependent receptor [Pelagerythrobacter marensis]|uniref:TonB-dependent receptor, plug n=1 Tax=Pelagerythrobacter marensis TaxID=543877 RepID=A0A0G3X9J3_9SPHN|nr:TonB-dependent receptor [Pelagerythrobacter marensis]AKM07877.1 TonB-dependent receptor, plug [Pelagerythrobacter marensis]
MPYRLPIVLAVLLAATAVQAEERRVDVPAGRASDAAAAIARQTGTSIVISAPDLAARQVPAIRGRYSAEEAVRRLARAIGARPVAAGSLGWRLVADQRRAPVAHAASRTPARAAAAPPALPPPGVGTMPIVVLASKRDVRLRDYAGQITILDGDSLSLGGPVGTDRIADRVASVTSTYLGSGRNKLFIRGIADSSFTGPTQATVGQYLGDLRLSYNSPDPDLRLSDMERVEVLEGPQGTLYGAGSLGGIIRLVPNEPEPGVAAVSGSVGGSATQHGAMGADAGAVMNLPLAGERLTLRAVFDAESQGGYIDKPLIGRDDVNRTNIYGGRAMARFDAGGDWTVDLIGLGQWTEGRDSQYADREGPPLVRMANVTEGFDADYLQGQVVVSGRLGSVRFRSSTGIVRQTLQERYDATRPGEDTRLFVQDNDSRMIANETRVWQPMEDRLGWVLGASYTGSRSELTRGFDTIGTANVSSMSTSSTGVRNTVDELTVYGEASYRLRQGLVATAGGRVTRSELGGQGEDVDQFLALLRAEVTAQRHETVFLPSLSLSASPIADTALYIKYQEGFRPGGLAIDGDFVRRFRSDRTATFEIGARHGQPGTGPFDLAGSLAFTRWRDIQADFIDPVGLPTTANIGDGQVWTATLSGGVAITRDLRIEGGVSWNDSRIDSPRPLEASRIGQVPNIANINVRAGFDYQRQLRGDLTLAAQGWTRYVGKSRLGIGPELGEEQGDYLDSGLTVRIGREAMGLSLGISNIFDTEGNRFALGTPFDIGRDQITPLRPRTFRLGLDLSF